MEKLTDVVSLPLCDFPVKAFFTKAPFFLARSAVGRISERIDRPPLHYDAAGSGRFSRECGAGEGDGAGGAAAGVTAGGISPDGGSG